MESNRHGSLAMWLSCSCFCFISAHAEEPKQVNIWLCRCEWGASWKFLKAAYQPILFWVLCIVHYRWLLLLMFLIHSPSEVYILVGIWFCLILGAWGQNLYGILLHCKCLLDMIKLYIFQLNGGECVGACNLSSSVVIMSYSIWAICSSEECLVWEQALVITNAYIPSAQDPNAFDLAVEVLTELVSRHEVRSLDTSHVNLLSYLFVGVCIWIFRSS